MNVFPYRHLHLTLSGWKFRIKNKQFVGRRCCGKFSKNFFEKIVGQKVKPLPLEAEMSKSNCPNAVESFAPT